jgi:hypothetical protein
VEQGGRVRAKRRLCFYGQSATLASKWCGDVISRRSSKKQAKPSRRLPPGRAKRADVSGGVDLEAVTSGQTLAVTRRRRRAKTPIQTHGESRSRRLALLQSMLGDSHAL